ncbi:MAG: dihydrofolate reductase family protein [Gemmatimonadaceae bacterium]
MTRPRVICHMATSIDGRIVVDGWPAPAAAAVRAEYEKVHATYEAQGWMCGRITMEPFAKRVRSESEVAREYDGVAPRDDYVAPGEFESFAFALDAHGRLAWESNDISGDHVVAILSERVSNEYLELLRKRGVSYLLAGRRDSDLPAALEKIGDRFGVRTLMLEGGGGINGSMLRAGLIDEVSLLIAPTADGAVGTPTLFDVDEKSGKSAEKHAVRLALESLERRSGDVIWLRYRVEK